ncbi:hypothetical protein AMELA_G00225110 [Ameiurus melas]|uniref:Uncharacterized protein n=1 Tax=Ameiurus melas TaxID=219545 RepID=A0A7J5ZZX4_AMEME|nr:hypothetical protein AMELA_G00225110 [Ameiurus melas]
MYQRDSRFMLDTRAPPHPVLLPRGYVQSHHMQTRHFYPSSHLVVLPRFYSPSSVMNQHHSFIPPVQFEDGSMITPRAPASDVLIRGEQLPPVSTSLPVSELERQPTSNLPPDRRRDAVSDLYPPTPRPPSHITGAM